MTKRLVLALAGLMSLALLAFINGNRATQFLLECEYLALVDRFKIKSHGDAVYEINETGISWSELAFCIGGEEGRVDRLKLTGEVELWPPRLVIDISLKGFHTVHPLAAIKELALTLTPPWTHFWVVVRDWSIEDIVMEGSSNWRGTAKVHGRAGKIDAALQASSGEAKLSFQLKKHRSKEFEVSGQWENITPVHLDAFNIGRAWPQRIESFAGTAQGTGRIHGGVLNLISATGKSKINHRGLGEGEVSWRVEPTTAAWTLTGQLTLDNGDNFDLAGDIARTSERELGWSDLLDQAWEVSTAYSLKLKSADCSIEPFLAEIKSPYSFDGRGALDAEYTAGGGGLNFYPVVLSSQGYKIDCGKGSMLQAWWDPSTQACLVTLMLKESALFLSEPLTLEGEIEWVNGGVNIKKIYFSNSTVKFEGEGYMFEGDNNMSLLALKPASFSFHGIKGKVLEGLIRFGDSFSIQHLDCAVSGQAFFKSLRNPTFSGHIAYEAAEKTLKLNSHATVAVLGKALTLPHSIVCKENGSPNSFAISSEGKKVLDLDFGSDGVSLRWEEPMKVGLWDKDYLAKRLDITSEKVNAWLASDEDCWSCELFYDNEGLHLSSEGIESFWACDPLELQRVFGSSQGFSCDIRRQPPQKGSYCGYITWEEEAKWPPFLRLWRQPYGGMLEGSWTYEGERVRFIGRGELMCQRWHALFPRGEMVAEREGKKEFLFHDLSLFGGYEELFIKPEKISMSYLSGDLNSSLTWRGFGSFSLSPASVLAPFPLGTLFKPSSGSVSFALEKGIMTLQSLHQVYGKGKKVQYLLNEEQGPSFIDLNDGDMQLNLKVQCRYPWLQCHPEQYLSIVGPWNDPVYRWQSEGVK